MIYLPRSHHTEEQAVAAFCERNNYPIVPLDRFYTLTELEGLVKIPLDDLMHMLLTDKINAIVFTTTEALVHPVDLVHLASKEILRRIRKANHHLKKHRENLRQSRKSSEPKRVLH